MLYVKYIGKKILNIEINISSELQWTVYNKNRSFIPDDINFVQWLLINIFFSFLSRWVRKRIQNGEGFVRRARHSALDKKV